MIFNVALGHTDGWDKDVGVWRVLGYLIVKNDSKGSEFLFCFCFCTMELAERTWLPVGQTGGWSWGGEEIC